MKIDINIETQLEAIWKKIGLGDEEIENEYSAISQKLQDLFISILIDFTTISDNLERKVEEIESKIYHYNHLIGGSDDMIKIDVKQPLKIRYEKANQQLYDLKQTFSARAKNYNSLYELLTNLFEILEIPLKDRGTFKEKGEDVSPEKIEEAGRLVFELNEAVDIRQKKMSLIIKELSELREKMRLKPVEMPPTLGTKTISQYEEELNYLDNLYKNCIKEKKKAINQIHQVEDFFSIESPNFVVESEKSENIDFCDEKELDQLLKYLEELQKEKSKQAPEFIEEDKQILLDLYQELHIQKPSIQEFPALYYRTNVTNSNSNSSFTYRNKSIGNTENNNNNILIKDHLEVLDELENEIERLNKYKDETEAIRIFLLQRDRIINFSKKKPKKFLSFNQIVANEKMVSVDLPIINIRLEPLLEDYLKKNKVPFLWDGKDVLIEIKSQNANFKEKSGMVHNRYVSSITCSKK